MNGIPLGMMASGHQLATGATFEPDDLASVIAWWDASDSSTITTQTVSSQEQVLTWTDKIDNVVFTSTGTGTSQGAGMIYNSAQGRINFQLDANSSTLQNTSTRLGLSGNPNIIIAEVFSANSLGEKRHLHIGGYTADYILVATHDFAWRYNNGNRVFNESPTIDQLCIAVWQRSSGSNYSAGTGYFNGTQFTNKSSGTGYRTPSNTNTKIAYALSFDNSFGGGAADSKVHDVIVANTTSSTDREKLEGYLAHKHSITSVLPSDHPYKTTPPTP